jgi:hypothetical protein
VPVSPSSSTTAPPADVLAEFDRQLANLLSRGYTELTGLPADRLTERVAPLREQVAVLPDEIIAAEIPFVLVVPAGLAPVHRTVEATTMGTRSGFTSLDADDLARFTTIESVEAPEREPYLLVDVDTGAETLGWKPQDALPHVQALGRSPLTIAEGIAVVTQVENVLRTHNCFQLMGSRCGDTRVPGIWVSDRRPRLGWCWDGNHHTWLGMASAAGRATGSGA